MEDVVAIDAGPMLLAIEYLRTRLVWQLFMKHAGAVRVVERLRLAPYEQLRVVEVMLHGLTAQRQPINGRRFDGFPLRGEPILYNYLPGFLASEPREDSLSRRIQDPHARRSGSKTRVVVSTASDS